MEKMSKSNFQTTSAEMVERRYQRVAQNKKNLLYWLVEDCSMSIHKASKECGIGVSNAKKLMKKRRNQSRGEVDVQNHPSQRYQLQDGKGQFSEEQRFTVQMRALETSYKGIPTQLNELFLFQQRQSSYSLVWHRIWERHRKSM